MAVAGSSRPRVASKAESGCRSQHFTCKPTSKRLTRLMLRGGAYQALAVVCFPSVTNAGSAWSRVDPPPWFSARPPHRHGSRMQGRSGPTMPDAPTDTSKVPSTPLGSPLPSLLANLAASEGSSLIHGSERRLNQPVMGGEHGGVSALSRFQEAAAQTGLVCPPPAAFPARRRPSLISHPEGKRKHLVAPLPRPATSVRLLSPPLLSPRRPPMN